MQSSVEGLFFSYLPFLSVNDDVWMANGLSGCGTTHVRGIGESDAGKSDGLECDREDRHRRCHDDE